MASGDIEESGDLTAIVGHDEVDVFADGFVDVVSVGLRSVDEGGPVDLFQLSPHMQQLVYVGSVGTVGQSVHRDEHVRWDLSTRHRQLSLPIFMRIGMRSST